MLMEPVVDKEDTTYIRMHSAINQADSIKDSLVTTTTTSNNLPVNGIGPRTSTNSPNLGESL